MATASTMPWYNNHHERSSSGGGGGNARSEHHHHHHQQQQQQHQQQSSSSSSAGSIRHLPKNTSTCPPSSFPDNFQDFFTALNEDLDDQPNMLEDKLIPRKDGTNSANFGSSSGSNNNLNNNNNNNNNNNSSSLNSINLVKQRWQKRTFQRRSSEVEVRLHGSSQSHGFDPKSPTPSRRRSSSIAVTRPTPDLHRFLQAEAGPWGHLSPSLRSPTRTPSLSPGGLSTSSHLSPGASPAGPSPTSPAAPASRLPPQPKHRGRTSSMPAVPRHRPMLADTRRGGLGNGAGIGGSNGAGSNGDEDAEDGVEYYRVRSFSITANGVFNLGDALKRRSRSINSVTSSNTSCSSVRDIKDVKLINAVSQLSGIENGSSNGGAAGEPASERPATYKVGMLGAPGVGKTALTAQFCTSEYICAYDASLDDEYGQKSVSVMIDGQETELEIIDHPAQEMSTESFCSTYNADVFVIVYSVVDRSSFKYAEQTLMYLWNNNYMASRGVILVGNMADLERKREVSTIMGRRVATTFNCKFIETSSGIAHHVDELLVGIIAQIKLNPQRNRDQANAHRRRSKHTTNSKKILKSILGGFHRKTKSCENLFTI